MSGQMSGKTYVGTGLILLAVTLGFLFPAASWGQVAGGTISGTVVDSSGRVIGNVQITITNLATGVTRDITTNQEGFYSAPNLLPGTYEAKFSAKGFKTEARSGIALTVGETEVLDLTMKVAKAATTIQVTAEPPDAHPANSDIS